MNEYLYSSGRHRWPVCMMAVAWRDAEKLASVMKLDYAGRVEWCHMLVRLQLYRGGYKPKVVNRA